ncbi:MAG: SpoIIE family protein phosphatase [Hyphomicrobiales bacterium]
MKRKTLTFKLSLIILPLIVLIFVIALLINTLVASKIILNSVKNTVRYQSESISKDVLSILYPIEKIAKQDAFAVREFIDNPNAIDDFVTKILNENEEIISVDFAFNKGIFEQDSIVVFHGKRINKNKSVVSANRYKSFTQEWYTRPLLLNSSAWVEPAFCSDKKDILISYSVLIKQRKEVVGVSSVGLSLNELSDDISNLKILTSGFPFLLSSKGTFVAYPDSSYILNETIFSYADRIKSEKLKLVGEDMINGRSGVIEINLGDGKELLFYNPLKETSWSIGVLIPERDIFSKIAILNKWILIVGILGVILIGLVIFISTNKTTRRLSQIVAASKRIGEGDINTDLPISHSNDEVGILSNAFRKMQIKLTNYVENLKSATEAKEKIESELRIAYEIQQGIIPRIFPPFPEREDVELFALLKPAKEVGGDLYDFFFMDESHLCIVVGDVSGKGVPASLFMAITRTLLRAHSTKDISVDNLVSMINKALCVDNDSGMFVTFFIGVLDLKTGILEFCNAGHNYPYILREDKSLEKLDVTHGVPLGILDDHPYSSDTVNFSKGDVIVLYTDGITEALNEKEEFYGDDRFEELLANISVKSHPQVIIDRILDDNKVFVGDEPQNDDITLLVLSYYWSVFSSNTDENI